MISFFHTIWQMNIKPQPEAYSFIKNSIVFIYA